MKSRLIIKCLVIKKNLTITHLSYILDCPTISMDAKNDSKDDSTLIEYTFQTQLVHIPFVDVYQHQLLIVLSPKREYQPHIDSIINSNGLKGHSIQNLTWSKDELTLPKTANLSVDSNYQLVLRLFGRRITQEPQNNDKSKITKSFISLDCVQKMINTKRYKCNDGTSIDARKICNSVDDCGDASDEKPSLCLPDETILIIVSRYSIISYLIVGIVCTVVILCMRKRNFFVEDDTDDSLVEKETKEAFLHILNECRRIKNTHRLVKKDSIEAFTRLVELYKSYHIKGPKYTLVFLQAAKDISEISVFYNTCAKLIDVITSTDHELYLNVKNEKRRLRNTLKGDYETADCVLSMRARNGFFSRITRVLIKGFRKLVREKNYPNICYKIFKSSTILLGMYSVLSPHLDFYFDISVYESLKHIDEVFIIDGFKLESISGIDIQITSNFYLICGVLSQMAIHIIYIKYMDFFIRFEPSKKEKVLAIISIAFPIHMIVIETTILLVERLKISRGITSMIEDLEKDDNEDRHDASKLENGLEKYVEFRKRLDTNMKHLKSVWQVTLLITVSKFVLETFPQTLVILTLLISDYANGYGKFVLLLGNSLKSLFGLGGVIMDGLTLIKLLITINACKHMLTTLKLSNRGQAPMGFGMLWSIMIMGSSTVLLAAKLMTLSICFISQFAVYPVGIVLEILVLFAHYKISNVPFDLLGTYLPCLITPALFMLKETEHSKPPKVSTICFATFGIYFMNLIVYILQYLAIQYLECFQSYRSPHSIQTHAIVAAMYCISIVPYLFITALYYKWGNRWSHLKVNTTVEKEFISMGDQAEIFRTKGKLPDGYVDPFSPETDAFMTRNIQEARQMRANFNNEQSSDSS